MRAAALLQTYSRSALERMARQRRLETKGQNKEALIRALAPVLFEPEAIRRALAALSPVERRVVEEVCVLGGDAPTGLIQRRLERAGLIAPLPKELHYGTRGVPSPSELPRLEEVVAQLGAAGLVFSSIPSSYGSTIDLATPGQRLFVPDVVRDQVPTRLLPLAASDPPAQVMPANPAALLRDVYTLLTFAQQSPIPLTTRGLIPKRALVRLDAELRVPEDAATVASEHELHRLPLLRALLEDLGLLVARAGALMATERVADFLSQPPGERHAQLVGAYRQSLRWCELFHVEGLQVESGSAAREAPLQVVAARQRVLAELAEVPAEHWILLDQVRERLKRCAYELLFRRQWPVGRGVYSYSPGPYRDSGNPLGWSFLPSLDEERGWDLVEGRLIQVVIEQALHWLGIIDLGGTGPGGTALRITADGARLLRGDPVPSTTAAPQVVVQPNFQIFAFEPTDESVLFTLDRVAERVRAEQVVEYHLSRESVYRAQRAGFEAAAIAAFLERVSSVPLPQNVRRSLEEWGALYERVVVRRGVPLLHAVDEAALDALYADAAIAPLLGRRVAPTAALVAPGDLPALRTRLLAGDRLPALSEGRERPAQPAFTVAGDGHILLRQPLPDIAVLRVLQQVTDQEADGPRRMTAQSVQRAAAAQGLGADDLLASLQRFHDGPLPAEVVVLVRRWAKRWGRGLLTAVTLLRVESPDVLADLFGDPEVSPHLSRLEGATTIAVVHPARVECVRSALQARGMDLAEQPL